MRKIISVILIVFIISLYFTPIYSEAYNVNDEYTYITKYDKKLIFNNTITAEAIKTQISRHKIVEYNSTTHNVRIYTYWIDFVAGKSYTTNVVYNTSKSKLYFAMGFTDLDANNYYNTYIMLPLASGVIFGNRTTVLDFLNATIRWGAGNASHVTLVSSHYDKNKGSLSATLKFPYELTHTFGIQHIKYSGSMTFTIYCELSTDARLINLSYSIKGFMTSATNGNLTYSDEFVMQEYSSSSLGGFDITQLFGGNTTLTIAAIGVVALIIGIAIGKKH